MEKGSKWLVGIAGVIGAGALLSASRLQQFGKEFVIETNARIHSFSFAGLVIAVDVTFKNPTDATLRLKHPFVRLFDSQANMDANQPFLSSAVKSTVYTIKPNSETTLDGIMLTINPLDISLALTVKQMVTNYVNGKAVTIFGSARTQLNGTVPIVQSFQSTFQRNVKAKTKVIKTTKA